MFKDRQAPLRLVSEAKSNKGCESTIRGVGGSGAYTLKVKPVATEDSDPKRNRPTSRNKNKPFLSPPGVEKLT